MSVGQERIGVDQVHCNGSARLEDEEVHGCKRKM